MASFSSSHFLLTSTQTALALIVPQNLQPEINSLRKIHDKAYRKWEPHINILYPFVEPTRLSSAVAILRETLRERHLKRVRVKIDEVGVFKHRRNATVFSKPDVESEENISQLRKILLQALGCNERDGTHDGIFRPHLTVGQAALNGTSIEKLVEQVGKLVGLDWESTTLAVLRRESSGEMKVAEELPLGNFEDTKNDGAILSMEAGWRSCYSFNADTGWNQSQEFQASGGEVPTPVEVTVATYNFMAESTAPSFTLRLQPIIEAISSTSLSTSSNRVLCLQEVNDEMLPLILAEPFIQLTFPFSTHTASSLLPSHRNLVTLSSKPFQYHLLQFTERHKTALVVSFYELPLQVANVHLTSALSNQAVLAKKSQMEKLTKMLTRHHIATAKETLVAGDFNLTTSTRTIETALSRGIITPETAQLVSRVVDPDVWEDTFNQCRPRLPDLDYEIFEGEEGATFDRLTNHLAAMSESPIDNRPQRYDRVLYRKGGSVRSGNFEIFGLPNEHGSCPSDHYAVSASVRIGDDGDANLNEPLPTCDTSRLRPSGIEVVEDSTDLHHLLEPYLPIAEDQEQRLQALKRLRQTLTSNQSTADLVLAPLGSYFMNTYFAGSDVDVLAIGSISPQVFFDVAITHLRAIDTLKENGCKGVRFVNSLVSIVEVCVLGIKFDLQYCQAAELVERYHSIRHTPNLANLVFDTSLISSLTPSSVRPLNTYRDTVFLLQSLPDLPSYRLAHRYLSLYLKCRGLYSAKFGYLGGIHLSLMLNRVVKLIADNSEKLFAVRSNDSSGTNVSPATIVRTFFTYYASFDWAEINVTDPSLASHRNVSRSSRDAIFIYSIHTPTARPNVASSCTRLTAQTLTKEFNLAANKLRLGDWQWCLRTPEASIDDFICGFGAFVRIQVDMWDLDEIGGNGAREMIGSLESRFPRLMVALGRISGLEGRAWPARFRGRKDEISVLKGYYLVGISSVDKDVDSQGKRLFAGKVIAAVGEFERSVKEPKEFEGRNIWISLEVVPKKKILEMDLVVDEREWEQVEEFHPVEPTQMVADELDLDRAETSRVLPSRSTQKPGLTSLRPAQDIISRIHWDSALSVDDFVIGYEDRFLGVKEIELARWKTEQTDVEFIPRHRIVWVRRKGPEGGDKVWDRRNKVDLIFGSGITRKT